MKTLIVHYTKQARKKGGYSDEKRCEILHEVDLNLTTIKDIERMMFERINCWVTINTIQTVD